jgi:hypothetical protein
LSLDVEDGMTEAMSEQFFVTTKIACQTGKHILGHEMRWRIFGTE